MNIINITANAWQTEEIAELVTALINFQEDFNNVSLKKDSKNPYLKNTYVSLDNLINTTRPLLSKNGLVIMQELSGKNLVTTLLHSSGQFKGALYEFSAMDANKGTNSIQEEGGGITYAKRYTWSALLGISTDTDTDGNLPKATPPATKKQPTKKPTPAKPTIPVENYEASALWLKIEGNTWPIIAEKYNVSTAAKKAINGMLKKFVEAELQKSDVPF
jgi:hypothetical protein